MLQFLDKLSLNYASAYTLIPDLGLEGQRYSWVAAIFNFGYLFWAIPANLLIQRLPIAKYIGGMIILWAILLCCHVAAKNYAGLLALRFVMGMCEACISPAIMNICALWYTREEQPLRMCIFLASNGAATMLGSLIGYGLGHADNTSLHSWQLIFLTIGCVNFVWATVFLLLTPDSPTTAKFLTHKQRVVAVHRVSENMVGVKTKQYKPKQILEALTDAKVILLFLMGLASGIINGGVSNFASSLIKGFGFSGLNATLLQLPLGAFELVVVPICGLVCTYFKNTRCLTLAVVSLIPFGGLLGIRFTSLDHRWTLVGCAWLQFISGGPLIVAWNILTTDVAGHTKRTIANGMWFTAYAAGQIGGAKIFFSREAPRYFSAITGLLICYSATIIIAGLLAASMWYDNRRRDRECERQGLVLAGNHDMVKARAIEDGFRDLTDKESVYFRYAL
jgi:MFS family permease